MSCRHTCFRLLELWGLCQRSLKQEQRNQQVRSYQSSRVFTCTAAESVLGRRPWLSRDAGAWHVAQAYLSTVEELISRLPSSSHVWSDQCGLEYQSRAVAQSDAVLLSGHPAGHTHSTHILNLLVLCCYSVGVGPSLLRQLPVRPRPGI